MLTLDDTIVAIASPAGGAAEGIVRLSGPGVHACIQACFRPDESSGIYAPSRATAVHGGVSLPGFHGLIPCRLYYWPDRRSYTGQPVAEIHTLGSPPLLEAIVRRLCAEGARPAEAGEFTLRAFLSGRIDLTQAEAVLGVIDALKPAELDTALTQLAGGLATPLHHLREGLIELLADLEAGLDFTDEDIRFITTEEIARRLAHAADNLRDAILQVTQRGEAGRAIRVVLCGRPNVGKSSLFNALAGKGGAIVSELPGTTRDYLSAELTLDGIRCELIDTAGLFAAGPAPPGLSPLDEAAAAVARKQQEDAHIRILCLDNASPPDDWETAELAAEVGRRIVAWTKIDLCGSSPLPATVSQHAIAVSSHTGQGIDLLKDAIRHEALNAADGKLAVVAATAIRCRESLRLAAEAILRAEALCSADLGEELIAAELRLALTELGRVVGTVYTDDILDRIFSRFCVGK